MIGLRISGWEFDEILDGILTPLWNENLGKH